ncbi:MAG TPA: glutathione peroxidase [Acetobacteraceae bacterium]|jgi:glutathione peroxidase|nr:glutathione peroxidase [Acetobacteraceae bacterium]
MADQTAWNFAFPAINGGTLALEAFKGRVLLVTNTASFCGYTGQYAGLQKLHAALGAKGLTVIGVPSQDFNQESPDDTTVKTFCETQYGVDFPLTGISHVRGPQAAPFYAWVRAVKQWEPSWNFNKVVVRRDGAVAGTFGSGETPEGAKLSLAIAAALG